MSNPFCDPSHIQGSDAWLAMRKKYIGASEAAIIMGVSPWRTPFQLWQEKLDLCEPQEINPFMQRGNDLEPLAREAFELHTGIEVFPQVVYHTEHKFMMASLDGLTMDSKAGVEIKLNGAKNHQLALDGQIPDYYNCQLQHQMSCTGLHEMYYWSFDGENGVLLTIPRDEKFIAKMIAEEKKFWDCVTSFTAPKLSNRDYVDKDSAKWASIGSRIAEIDILMETLKSEKEALREELINDADGHSCRGSGITLTKVVSRGRINYAKIPELKQMDVEKYRGPSVSTWRLTCKVN